MHMNTLDIDAMSVIMKHGRISHVTMHRQFKCGVIYGCNMCVHKATISSNLTQHKKNKHFGVKHPCD